MHATRNILTIKTNHLFRYYLIKASKIVKSTKTYGRLYSATKVNFHEFYNVVDVHRFDLPGTKTNDLAALLTDQKGVLV